MKNYHLINTQRLSVKKHWVFSICKRGDAIEMLKLLYFLGFRKRIDYKIIGEYWISSDNVHYTKKYIKRYYIKKEK